MSAIGQVVVLVKFEQFHRSQELLLPPDLREWVPADDPAHLVVTTVERVEVAALEMDRRATGKAQAPHGRCRRCGSTATPAASSRRGGRSGRRSARSRCASSPRTGLPTTTRSPTSGTRNSRRSSRPSPRSCSHRPRAGGGGMPRSLAVSPITSKRQAATPFPRSAHADCHSATCRPTLAALSTKMLLPPPVRLPLIELPPTAASEVTL